MSSRSVSRLDPGLIARKGQAAPATPSVAAVATVETAHQAAFLDPQASTNGSLPEEGARQPARGVRGTIAVTVRLDPSRYERLKVHGARMRRTNQQILVEALDNYFRNKA